MIGPKGLAGEESFDILVCTPQWLIQHHTTADIVVGRHYLFMFEYNYERLVKMISMFCDRCSGSTWKDVACRLSRLGKWEFEDYEPTPER